MVVVVVVVVVVEVEIVAVVVVPVVVVVVVSDGLSDGSSVQSTIGAALRKLTNFFDQKDPDKTFCRLSRFVDNSTGHCIWTTEENIKKMESVSDDDMILTTLQV